MSALEVSERGRKLIEQFEGLVLHAYQDVVGVWTIGYGHTDGVQPGDTISRDMADRMLSQDLGAIYGPAVKRVIGDAPTTQEQFDAMVSLTYNVGPGAFQRSTVARMHRAGNHQAAADAFLLFNRAGGRELPALTRRRRAEADLYLSSPRPNSADIDAVVDDFEAVAKRLQLALRDGGYYRGAIDGDFGPQSRQALVDYKSRLNPT